MESEACLTVCPTGNNDIPLSISQCIASAFVPAEVSNRQLLLTDGFSPSICSLPRRRALGDQTNSARERVACSLSDPQHTLTLKKPRNSQASKSISSDKLRMMHNNQVHNEENGSERSSLVSGGSATPLLDLPQSSPVNETVPSVLASLLPCHHLSMTNLKPGMDMEVVVDVLEAAGDIKMLYSEHLHSSGIFIVSFYDMRDAIHAHRVLGDLFKLSSYSGAAVSFMTDTSLSLLCSVPFRMACAETVLVVSLFGATERLATLDYKSIFETWGALRSESELEFTALCKVVCLVFYDERSAGNAHVDMDCQIYQGVTFQIRRCAPCEAPMSSDDIVSPPAQQLPMTPVCGTANVGKQLDSKSPTCQTQASQYYSPCGSHVLREDGACEEWQNDADMADCMYVLHPVTLADIEQEREAANRSMMSFFYENRDNTSPAQFSLFSSDPPHGPRQFGMPERPHVRSPSCSSLATDDTAAYVTPPQGEPPLTHLCSETGESTPAGCNAAPRTPPPQKPSKSDVSNTCSEYVSACSSPIPENPPVLDNAFDLKRVESGLDKRTTFMIRNIPNKYTQKMLMECIDTTHKGTYDFLYLRIDFQNKCNVGYAFINFIDVRSVISFAREREGKRWNRFNSEKRCSLSYANIQGKEALIEKFRNSTVMEEDESYRPKIFSSSGHSAGKEEHFPPPTIPVESRRQTRRRRDMASTVPSCHSDRG